MDRGIARRQGRRADRAEELSPRARVTATTSIRPAPSGAFVEMPLSGGHGAKCPCPRLKLPAVDHGRAAEGYARRRADVALPDAAIIELDAHAIGRIDSALVARIDPDTAVGRAPVGPGPIGLTRFRREVH